MKIGWAMLSGAACLGISGCTLAGVMVGGVIPKKEAVDPATTSVTSVGEAMEVSFVDATGPHLARGTYGGRDGDAVLIVSGAGTTRVPIDRISEVRVNKGTYWVDGMVAGFTLDASCLLVLIAGSALSPKKPTFGSGSW
jgi:hypothetical protein